MNILNRLGRSSLPLYNNLSWSRPQSPTPRVSAVVLTLLTLVLLVGCGKRRPPLPPIERVQQRTELLSGAQQGNEVILSWPAPQRNAPDSSVQSIRRIDVYRLAEKPGAPLPLTEDEFSARSTLVGSVTSDEIRTAGEKLTYIDKLELAGQPTRLRYAVRFVNASGQRAAFSNFLLIEPAARVAQPPVLVTVDLTETAINLSWQAPTANIDGSTPVNILGYNIYRLDESQNQPGQTPINSSLVAGTTYSDKTFKFRNEYRYLVRAVSLGTEGAQVESLNSNARSVIARDIFPPAPPAQPGIAADLKGLSIFFAPNSESDIAGYNIYRSTDPNLPKASWIKLNQVLLTRPSYVDEKVERGRKYYYYVTAVDTSGNVSEPSEVNSETMP